MKKLVIGGQAVIEGVMMKSPKYLSIAVRKPNKKISVKTESFKSIADKYKWLGWPLIRGVVNLIEMLAIGMQALTFSANEASGEEEEELTKTEIITTFLAAMLFTVAFFIILPFYLSKLVVTSGQGILFNLLDGLIRVGLFLVYVLVIPFMKDIRAVFQYHGAEHKSVHCYESGKKLTVKNTQKFSTLHPRCGTSFLLIVLVISILIFSLITSEHTVIKILARVVLLPVIAGLSYELLRFSARHEKTICCRAIIWPGLMLQKLTTREPTDKQVEVAIKALEAVLKKEKVKK
jgi:uncharacterized protein YqhQ